MSVIGLDLGTSRVKAVRFDDSWQIADSSAEITTVSRPRPGWSEQDMTQVWHAACRVLHAVAQDDVTLVAVTAQGDGCWLVDRAGEPVRPAMLWNDSRAAAVIDRWNTDGTLDRAFRRHGCDGAPGLAHAELRWLLEHEPGTVHRAATLLSCGSWVFSRLTGQRLLHVSEAHNPFHDAATGQYDDDLLAEYGLADLRPLLPPAVTGPDTVHPVRRQVATDLDLPAGTAIVLAPYDVVAAAIGVGATDPGRATAILGTTVCVELATEDPRLGRPRNGMTLPIGAPHRWLLAYATLAGTEILDWTATLLGLPGAADLAALAETASSADPPLLLPYLSPAGERAPFLDPTARGTLTGVTLNHSRADIARATLDGLALAVRDCLTAAGTADALAVCGGGARSEHWCQTISDATGLPVTCPNTPETGARGAALAGAVAVGRYRGLDEAYRQVIRPRHTHEPCTTRQRYFDDAYPRLIAARQVGAHHL